MIFPIWNGQIPSLFWKINYGPNDFVTKQWKVRMNKFKDQLSFFNKTAFTFRAKSILSKSKLFPLLSYTGMVHSVPTIIKKEINRLMLQFLVPFLPTKCTTEEIVTRLEMFGASRSMGGYEVDLITLHLELLLLKNVMKYLKCVVSSEDELPCNLYFVEYNIGYQVRNLFNIPVKRNTPHAQTPNSFYSNVLQIIRLYNLTLAELTEGSVNGI